jgi:SHS2 domain-containing protein
MTFELRDHTADVLAECSGRNLDELLTSAMQALYAVAVTYASPLHNEQREIRVYAYSQEELLVRWLQEVLYLLDSDGFIGETTTCTEIEKDCFSTVLTGYIGRPIERATEIKAVTYHDLEVRMTPSGLCAGIVFDL